MSNDTLAIAAIESELKKARGQHANMASAHEAYAVLLEEVDEFWSEVKKRRADRRDSELRKELIQIGAMAARALSDLGLMEI